MDDFQKALDLMAESINHMNVSRQTRDTIRAGMKCACEKRQHLSTTLKHNRNAACQKQNHQ
jgi:hypothetical protein